MPLVQSLTVDELGLTIKFGLFVKVSSLIDDAFSLVNSLAQTIALDPIDQFDDYNTISRVLRLTFTGQTLASDTYTFTIAGLRDSANQLLSSYTISFDAGNPTQEDITVPLQEPIFLIDKSIRSQAFMTSETIFTSNPDFYVVSTDPENFDTYVPSSYNSGRITIKFSVKPDFSTLNSDYFKVQRKPIQRLPARWENIPVHITLDDENPWVYIDFPSVDSTQSYTVPGVTYFVTGYKYRIILSKNIGI